MPRRIGVVALIETGGALLLDRRADSGRWALVGGRLEENETLGEALVREILEETGLVVERYRLFGTFSDPSRRIQYPDGSVAPILTLAYRVRVSSFDPLRPSEESMCIQLVPHPDLSRYDIVETHRHIVDAYLSGAELVLE